METDAAGMKRDAERRTDKQLPFPLGNYKVLSDSAVATWRRFAASEQHDSEYPLRKFRNNKVQVIGKYSKDLCYVPRPDTRNSERKGEIELRLYGTVEQSTASFARET